MTLMTQLHLDELPLEERVRLAYELWDNIGEEAATVPLSLQHQQELDRRLDDYQFNPGDVILWDKVQSAAIARLSHSTST